MATSLIAFGANLGDPAACFDRTCRRLSGHQQITLVARSRHYTTAPVGGPAGQPDFLNAALLIETSLSPQELLILLNQVELDLGRQRQARWDQRVIDLDLLLYDTVTVNVDNLMIPHPRMAFRRFVLEPAVEIAPSLIHPQTGWSVQQLFDHLCSARNYIALVGPAGSGKTKVAIEVSEQLHGHLLLSDNSLTEINSPLQTPVTWESAFMEQRMDLLATISDLLSKHSENDHGQRCSGDFVISDFWLNQSYPYLQSTGSREDQERFTAKWKSKMATAIQPKLRVFLDPFGPSPNDNSGAQERHLKLNLALQQFVQEPLQGPLLHLTDCEPRSVLREVAAAVQSML